MIGCLSNYSFDNFLFKTWYVNHNQGGWWWYFYRPSQFSFNNSETVKALNLAFCNISKFSLEIFMSNLVLLTGPSLQILKISIWPHSPDIEDFNLVHCIKKSRNLEPKTSFFVQWLFKYHINENCYNSRSSNDIDMKFRPVTKLDKRNKTTSKRFDDGVVSANCDVFLIFHFSADLKQSGNRYWDTWFIILEFSSVAVLYLTKIESN